LIRETKEHIQRFVVATPIYPTPMAALQQPESELLYVEVY
jgi:hypothetical protein